MDSVGGYVSGPAAATEPRRLALEHVASASAIVLVEGVTDQIAVETLATRCGRDLAGDRVVVAPMGGAHAIGTFLQAIADRDAPATVVGGLCDRGEAAVFRSALARAGFGSLRSDADLEAIGFFVCDADLEAELIRAAGPALVMSLIDDHGELGSFRSLQQQTVWRSRPVEEQLHRFFRAKARRMHRYARVLTETVALDRMPRPLLGVLGLEHPVRGR
ncbi:MAG: TOPRIM nucleotidyl transferase/hydrolase domain-containing protein [Ilumatobacteraceae bacterium]